MPIRVNSNYVTSQPALSDLLGKIVPIIAHIQGMAVNPCGGNYDFMDNFPPPCGYSTIYNATQNYVLFAILAIDAEDATDRYIHLRLQSPITGTALPPAIAGKKISYFIEDNTQAGNPDAWVCTTNIDEVFLPTFKSMALNADQISIVAKVKLSDVTLQQYFKGCTYVAEPFTDEWGA